MSPDDDDWELEPPLAAARGIAIGLALGAGLWALIIAAWCAL